MCFARRSHHTHQKHMKHMKHHKHDTRGMLYTNLTACCKMSSTSGLFQSTASGRTKRGSSLQYISYISLALWHPCPRPDSEFSTSPCEEKGTAAPALRARARANRVLTERCWANSVTCWPVKETQENHRLTALELRKSVEGH